ncbi:MAG: Rib/alpha-like domain-containing protein, partial [Finegoldia magna]|nr:Rib/alpha-like domain-containing protein [Finegoldia magna]
EGEKLPDGKTEGTHKVKVVVTYPDNSTEEVEVPIIVGKAKDTTKPSIGDLNDDNNPNTPPTEKDKNNKGVQVWANGARVVEGKQIDPIKVVVTDDKDQNPTVTVTGLPEGLSYSETSKQIEGTPTKLTDWGETEEERGFTATITAKDEAGNTETKSITITVLRDTDGDGIPDTIDKDDDGDGVSDEDEKKAGTDSKDKDSKPEEKKTSVDDSNVKPVNPTDEKQGTGVKVENPDKDTKVSAKDEDGNDVPAEINPETGEVEVTPGKDVDGPINVTVEDPDLPGGNKDITVPVNGHEKGKDDNNSETTPKAEEYQIVFVANEGAPQKQIKTVKEGEKVTDVTEPTREGYKFV